MAGALVNDFVGKLVAIEDLRARAENASVAGALQNQDVLIMYEALFLKMVVGLEAFLEKLFVRALLGQTAYPAARCRPLVQFDSTDVMNEILLQGDNYLDWLPYPRTVTRARMYFEEGRPFSALNDGFRGQLQQILIIRHAIAHASPHAIKSFEDKVLGSTPLLPAERSPGGYLRSIPQSNTTRFQIFATQLAKIANEFN